MQWPAAVPALQGDELELMRPHPPPVRPAYRRQRPSAAISSVPGADTVAGALAGSSAGAASQTAKPPGPRVLHLRIRALRLPLLPFGHWCEPVAGAVVPGTIGFGAVAANAAGADAGEVEEASAAGTAWATLAETAAFGCHFFRSEGTAGVGATTGTGATETFSGTVASTSEAATGMVSPTATIVAAVSTRFETASFGEGRLARPFFRRTPSSRQLGDILDDDVRLSLARRAAQHALAEGTTDGEDLLPLGGRKGLLHLAEAVVGDTPTSPASSSFQNCAPRPRSKKHSRGCVQAQRSRCRECGAVKIPRSVINPVVTPQIAGIVIGNGRL